MSRTTKLLNSFLIEFPELPELSVEEAYGIDGSDANSCKSPSNCCTHDNCCPGGDIN